MLLSYNCCCTRNQIIIDILTDSNNNLKPAPIKKASIKKAFASSQHASGKFGPGNAIDGKTSTFFNSNDGIKPWLGFPYPWLQVELENTGLITRIVIVNRQDCCWFRTKKLQVRVGPSKIETTTDGKAEQPITENTLCGEYEGPGSKEEEIKIDCQKPIEGKYVTLQLMIDSKTVMNVAEVKVYRKGIL